MPRGKRKAKEFLDGSERSEATDKDSLTVGRDPREAQPFLEQDPFEMELVNREPVDGIPETIAPIPETESRDLQMFGICPTLNRPEMAARLAASAKEQGLSIGFSYEVQPRALTACINECLGFQLRLPYPPDIVFLLGDHVVFEPGCVHHVREIFRQHIPDLNGAVGMRIRNLKPEQQSPYAFMAVGRALLDRFPNWQAFCPDYYHFYGDTELGMFAKEAGTFIFAEGAGITTYSPGAGNMQMDDTYRAGRVNKAQDQALYEQRQSKGLLWGRSFDLVNVKGWK